MRKRIKVSPVPKRYPMPAGRTVYRLTDAARARLAPLFAVARKQGLKLTESEEAATVRYPVWPDPYNPRLAQPDWRAIETSWKVEVSR